MPTHDETAFQAYKQYKETGLEPYLLRTCLSLTPLASSVATRFKYKFFDLDAVINDCFVATYRSLKRGNAVFDHRRKLWEYYYKKYICVCRRYWGQVISIPIERNLYLEDAYRINHIFNNPRTVKDVDDKIFIEEELPEIMRKAFKRRLRFKGVDRKCCLHMLEAALSGKKIKVSHYYKKRTKHSARFLRDYTRVIIRSLLYKYYKKFSNSLFISNKLAEYYDTGRN